MSVLDQFSLKGKVAVLTGGAGLYGRQIAQALAEAGARTFMASRDQAKLRQQSEAFAAQGLTVTPMPLDQGDAASVRKLLTLVLDRLASEGWTQPRVDVLVNNAVLRPMKGWSYDGAVEDFARSMEVNATGVYAMTLTFGEHMAEGGSGSGSIINVGSIQGMVGADLSLYKGTSMGTAPDYFFHKGGMLNLTRYTAAILGPRGVRVNCLSPGGFFNNQPEPFLTRYCASTFLGRMAGDTDLMGAVVFLASDASAYITGANLPVDGGYTAR